MNNMREELMKVLALMEKATPGRARIASDKNCVIDLGDAPFPTAPFVCLHSDSFETNQKNRAFIAAAINFIRTHGQALASDGGGMVLVPREPTEAMLRGAKSIMCDHSEYEDWLYFNGEDMRATWAAMLAASPKPSDGGEGL